MLIKISKGWELPMSSATPQHMLGRRNVLGGVLASTAALSFIGSNANASPPDGVRVDTAYPAGRELTTRTASTTYNNYYEFSEKKDIWQAAQGLPQSPWTVQISGMVEKQQTLSIDDLVARMPLEQRVLRHRCVEAWAMTVPWTGFPLAKLVEMAKPLSSAKYVTFTSAALPRSMPGLRNAIYPWPYQEGIAIQEAMNPLAFIATGMYQSGLPPQNGGPIRLLLPWKYGFKSAKALVKIGFTDTQPTTFWQAINPDEYGFYANVNPDVPHPRWSQATERLLGSGERVPTQLFNGYGEFVSSMYPAGADRSYFF